MLSGQKDECFEFKWLTDHITSLGSSDCDLAGTFMPYVNPSWAIHGHKQKLYCYHENGAFRPDLWSMEKREFSPQIDMPTLLISYLSINDPMIYCYEVRRFVLKFSFLCRRSRELNLNIWPPYVKQMRSMLPLWKGWKGSWPKPDEFSNLQNASDYQSSNKTCRKLTNVARSELGQPPWTQETKIIINPAGWRVFESSKWSRVRSILIGWLECQFLLWELKSGYNIHCILLIYRCKAVERWSLLKHFLCVKTIELENIGLI